MIKSCECVIGDVVTKVMTNMGAIKRACDVHVIMGVGNRFSGVESNSGMEE